MSCYDFQTFLSGLRKEITMSDRIAATSIFGCDIYAKYPRLLEIAQHRNTLTAGRGSGQIFRMMYTALFKIKENMGQLVDVLEKVKAQFSRENIRKLNAPRDIWDFILRGYEDLKIAVTSHTIASQNSTMTQMFLFNAMLSKCEKLTNEHQTDISTILGSISDIESASIPQMIREIAGRIMLANQQEKFLKIDSKDAVDWLKKNSSDIYKLFEAFLKRHGHRSINELDFISTPWIEEPELIIDMIKANLRIPAGSSANSAVKADTMSDDEILDKIKVPTTAVTRAIIRWMLPKCKRGVQNRETCKSQLVAVINEIRQGLKYLAERLVQEGFLPDKSLIFHFSKQELSELIATRDAKLVSKAIRRQKMFPKLSETKFPEIGFGVPKPLSMSTNDAVTGDILVIGIPVCGGTVTANACVCRTFADAEKLQKGDILVTYGTDIGWSPYFPILGGICTEIGGLISHGAVVAREYGLPCIVGATFATNNIKNGQKIILNANEGTIKAAK